jgi:hypothetical protein
MAAGRFKLLVDGPISLIACRNVRNTTEHDNRSGRIRPMCVTSSKGIDVAPVSKERVDPILENYLLALAGVDQCSQSAPEVVRSRLAVNLERAERAYSDAAADGLDDVSVDMEAELGALARVNERSRRRLHRGASITELLVELEQGTEQASRIVRAAISRH